jgi:hypothetical protein
MLEKKNDALIAAKAVLARYGGICGMTLHRWVRDPDLNFPKRLLINGRAILAALGAARLGIRGPDAFNPHTRRRNNHASHGRRSYACCGLKTLRAQRTYPFQEADPADREQHRTICGRPPRALRFGPMIFGPKGFAPGPFEGDTR